VLSVTHAVPPSTMDMNSNHPQIIQRYNGFCPECQKRLSYEPERVRITSYEEKLASLEPKRKWGRWKASEQLDIEMGCL